MPGLGLLYFVPKPDDRVSLKRARAEFEQDACAGSMIDLTSLELDMLSFVSWNAAMWIRYWAVHDPDPWRRVWLQREVEKDQAWCRKVMSLVERLLREQGYPEMLQ